MSATPPVQLSARSFGWRSLWPLSLLFAVLLTVDNPESRLPAIYWLERGSSDGPCLYCRVLVSAQAHGTLLQRTAAPLVNVNLQLSRRLLYLTERQRALQLSRLLEEVVGASASDVVLLDNMEILFDVSLMNDPLRFLRRALAE